VNGAFARLVALFVSVFFTARGGNESRPAYGSVFDLRDNVFVSWVLRRAKRDPWTIGAGLTYLVVLYGIVGVIYTFLASAGWRGSTTKEFLMTVHAIAWGANAFLFVLYVPTRFAQLIAFERERRTLDWLRMTPLHGWKLAIGCLASAYAVPLGLALTSIPHIFASLFSEIAGYAPGVLSAYSALAATSILATTLAGVVAFLPKKAAQASGGAFIVVIGLNIAGSMFQVPYFETFGCFGPWGGLIGPIEGAREPFVVSLFGTDFPGIALQVPLCVALGAIFLRAVANKMDDERTGLFGAREAALATIVLGIAALVSYSPVPHAGSYYYGGTATPGAVMGGRLLVLFLSMLPFAADSALTRDDLVRGLARAPAPPKPEERLSVWRAPLIAIAVLGVFGLVFSTFLGPTDRRSAVVIAGLCAGSYIAAASLAFQAARLIFPNRVPNVIAFAGLVLSWVVPLFASKIFHEIGAPAFLEALPKAFCPFLTIFSSAEVVDGVGASVSVDPVSMALVGILFNVLIAAALVAVIRGAAAQAADFAETLVSLPADAFAAPGTVENKCPVGHVYAATWATCPHCA
jgi:hypothetical protein